MLVDHSGVMVWLLAGLVGQVMWVEAALGRTNTAGMRWLKAFVLIVPIVVAPLSELVARESGSRPMQRRALWVCVASTGLYLAINACVATLPWISNAGEVGVACTVAATIVAGLTLRWAVRSIATGSIAAPYDDLRAKPRSWAHAIEREAGLLGGTSLSMTAVSIALVAAGGVGLWTRPDQRVQSVAVTLFFALCGFVAFKSGLDRRSALRGARGL